MSSLHTGGAPSAFPVSPATSARAQMTQLACSGWLPLRPIQLLAQQSHQLMPQAGLKALALVT